MKSQTICIYLLLIFLSAAQYTFAQQENVIASAQPKAENKTAATIAPATPAATPTEETPEEKEEEEPKLTFSGSVDTYFHTSFGSEADAPGTSFANLPGFGLGMVNLIGSYAGPKAGFTADLVFGPRGKDAVFGDTYTSQSIINQMYVFYKISDVVTLNMGQFNTFLGYEVISPTVNFHYSTSYMFSYGPFNHTGVRADFNLKKGLVAKLAIMNPTDIVEFNAVDTYTLGGQIGYTNEKGGIWFNFLAGDQDGKLSHTDPNDDGYSEGMTLQGDITTGWSLTNSFYLGLNTTYRTVSKGQTYVGDDIVDADESSKGFMGVALYPKLTLSETFALGLRAEYFKVTNNYITPIGLNSDGDGGVVDLTLTANYKVNGLTIIPEFRIDSTSEDSYQKKDSDAYSKTLSTFTLAAVYKF